MKIAIIKERTQGENRVSASPETVKKMVALGAEVFVESGAGTASSITDEAFKAAGAKIEHDVEKILPSSDVVLKVQPPFEKIGEREEYSFYKSGSILISHLSPFENKKNLEELAKSQITSFSMEFIPRISRAQSMDALSSQSNIAGYKAVIDAVAELEKAVPLMMTAAGTIQPAKVLILGAGVAGLQAIATAKRLGAVVSAFDVRPVVKEQVESLGAKFVEVASEEATQAETKGGYAKEMSEDYKRKQSELIHETLKSQDIVITTALIPGRKAPVLITREMVHDMKDGSVIVDMAVSAGGNCEYSQPGKTIKEHGVTIIGHENIPSRVARDASLLYARNIFNFLANMIDKETKNVKINKEDEIIRQSLITQNGKIVHPKLSNEEIKSGERKKKLETVNSTPKKVLEKRPFLKDSPTPRKQKRTKKKVK